MRPMFHSITHTIFAWECPNQRCLHHCPAIDDEREVTKAEWEAREITTRTG